MKIIDIYNGKTKAYGIIGNPVDHSFSPVLQNTIASVCNDNCSYTGFNVESGHVKKVLEGAFELGYQGFNVTAPHKVEVMECLDGIDEVAEKIGSVNTLKRTDKGYKGYNTDIIGLAKCFEMNGFSIEGERVIILGAGGASKAAVVMAAEKKAKEIYIINRTVEKAEALAESVRKHYDCKIYAYGYESLKEIENCSYVINTTSAGMGKGNSTSVIEDTTFFADKKAVVDIVYVPWETKLLADAKEKGCVGVNGFDMLIYQGIASYEIWHDKKIDEKTAKEIRDALAVYYKEKILGDANG